MRARVFPGRPVVSLPFPRPSAVLILILGLGLGTASAAAASNKTKEIQYPDGKLKERFTYTIDAQNREIREGQDQEFFANGAKKGEITWQNGKENGPVIYYYPDGRKSYEANYREGKKNGYATVWYPNGQKQWQTVFREGLTHGLWREWFADGKKKFEANYGDGKLDGLATWWYENGRMWQERNYQDGALVKGSVREWDRAGRQTFPPADGGDGVEPDGAATPSEPAKQDTTDSAGMGRTVK
jgi:antitoxin component YwqK of YwqJK toxin-antitoxin module